jgi:hypothetical protein
MLRTLAATTAPVGLTVAVAVAGVPAHASPSSCGADAVSVVVDPGPLGGRPEVGCVAEGGGLTAAETVERAGFDVEYAVGQPFVCRVDGAPGPQQESCVRTPPADAYWGLFWSETGAGPWTYSTLGAAALQVPDGGAIGLRFQDGGEREEPRVAGRAEEPPQEERPAPSEEEDSGALVLVAGGAVVALAAAAGAVAWRRRG